MIGRWQDYIDLDVEVETYAGDAGLWDQGLWDQGLWAGSTAGSGLMWMSVYDRVTAVSIQRGRPNLVESAETGTCQVDVINDDGWASGRQTGAGQAPLVPGRGLRITARAAGSTGTRAPIWTGYVDDVSAPWHSPTTALATIRGVDAMSRLSLIDPPETAVGREEHRDRLNKIADMAHWTGGRDWVPDVYVILQPGTIAQNLLTEAQLVAASATSYLYATQAGALATRLLTSPGAGAVYKLTNGTDVSNVAGTWCPLVPIPYPGSSAAPIHNQINLASVGGAIQTYDDSSSQTLFGLRPWGRQDLVTEGVLSNYAHAILEHDAWPRFGNTAYALDLPDTIRVGPPINLALLDLGAYIDVDLTMHPADTEPWAAYTGQTRVCSVEHSITEDTWTVTATVDQTTGTKPAAATAPAEQEALTWA